MLIEKWMATVLLIPVIAIVSFLGVNFVSDVLVGDINIITWVSDHRFIIGLVCAWIVFKVVKKRIFNK